MSQWGFYFNQTRCIGCKACMAACKAWNDDKRGDRNITPNLGWLDRNNPVEVTKYEIPADYEFVEGGDGEVNYAEFRKYHLKENWRRVTTTEYGDAPPDIDLQHLSIACNHCDDPACVKSCPLQIIYKEPEFGAVLVDNSKCISCGRCQEACPWDRPQFYDPKFREYPQGDPLTPKMTKCTLCLDRIREALKPACVAACINRALYAGPIDELKEKYAGWKATADTFESDFSPRVGTNTNPNIIFTPRKRRF